MSPRPVPQGPNLAAVVLAGGGARRMGGGDKPLLQVGDRSMLQAVIDAIGLPDIAISANGDAERFAAFGRPVLPDQAFAAEGPLSGLLAGLHWAAGLGADALLTVPGDMPFLPIGFSENLLPAPRAVMTDGRQHHLVATWPVACIETLRSWLHAGSPRRVASFAQRIGMQYVDFSVVSPEAFANINTPRQLEAARRITEATGQTALDPGIWKEFDV